MNNWTDTPLAQRVAETLNDINGYLPMARAYRRLAQRPLIALSRAAKEERRQAELEYVEVFIRVMYHNRATERENIRNLLFFSRWFQNFGIFEVVTIALPSESLLSMGSAVLGNESGNIYAPKFLLDFKINDPLAIKKARLLSTLVRLLQEGHFKVLDYVQELLARTEVSSR